MFPRREGAGAGFALRLTGQARRGSLAGRLELSPEGKHTDYFFSFLSFWKPALAELPITEFSFHVRGKGGPEQERRRETGVNWPATC